MPGRQSVTLYVRGKRDTWTASSGVLCERRPANLSESRGESGGKSSSFEYVFWRVELEALPTAVTLKEGDIIKDANAYEGEIFNAIDSISVELQGRRIRCRCNVSTDPTISI